MEGDQKKSHNFHTLTKLELGISIQQLSPKDQLWSSTIQAAAQRRIRKQTASEEPRYQKNKAQFKWE